MSCIAILYIALFHADAPLRSTFAPAAIVMQPSGQQAGTSDPDALYANRTDLASAKKAAEIWEARLRENSKDFDSAAKLTRTYYWLGRHAPDDERRGFLERGIAAGRRAVALEPNRPEGHFWFAANMGGLAESFGLRQGLKYRGEIRDELMTTLRLDAAFQQGSADRALGRWYYKVPGLFGGSNAKAEEHLRRSLTYSPENTASLYFLAEVLIATKRGPEAQAVLQKLIASPGEPGWGPEDHEYKVKGQRLLDKLKSGE
jgi:tetratricopeptide (TPR) repeat protein